MDQKPEAGKGILTFKTATELYNAVAVRMRDLASKAVAQRGRFLLVLAGGETPKPLYEKLAQDPAVADFPWRETHVFWGDERAVPPDDAQSNFRTASEYLLSAVPLPEVNIHRIRGELAAATAARLYARDLQLMADPGLAWPRFDLVLLGLGSDGHTASLFPGSTHPSRSAQATLAVTGSYGQRPTSRVTLTPPVFNSARDIFFLVIGERKADVVASVLQGKKSAVRFPARRIKPTDGSITWYLDRAAAARLNERILNDHK